MNSSVILAGEVVSRYPIHALVLASNVDKALVPTKIPASCNMKVEGS